VIDTIQFGLGPLGLELEMVNNHIICTKVQPNSQAAKFEKTLSGARIIAINNNKIGRRLGLGLRLGLP
jgi:C-terminal processing protease CtpA/Prc